MPLPVCLPTSQGRLALPTNFYCIFYANVWDISLPTMAPTTPRTRRTVPPLPRTPRNRKTIRKERSTGTRSRFFEAWDRRFNTKESITDINQRFGISARTSLNWRNQAYLIGQKAAERRPSKHRPGRTPALPDSTLDTLLNPQKNPVRRTYYEHQIDHFNLPITPFTLKRNLTERRQA